MDGIVMPGDLPKAKATEDKFARRKHELALLTARVAQRELLSTMLILLRAERFAPLLGSDLEQRYAETIKSRAKTGDLKNIKKAGDISVDDRRWIHIDPIHNVPVGYPAIKSAGALHPETHADPRLCGPILENRPA